MGTWGDDTYPPMMSGGYAAGLRPTALTMSKKEQGPPEAERPEGDIHLRSSKEVMRYKIEAIDAEFGHIEDLFFEEGSWKIRYLVIDTKSFWPSKSVILPPDWVDSVSWSNRKFRIKLPGRVIKQAPEFDPAYPIDRDFEKRLYAYYQTPGYWETEGLSELVSFP